MPLALQLISSTDCSYHFFEVSPLLNFYMVPLQIMRIFIPLVVVFILVYVIIRLTNFSPVAFLAFFWVTTPLTKGFVVLILSLLGYVSPAMLNLMRLTFSFSLPLRLNPYPSSNSQIFWNPVFPLQPCYHLPLCLIPGILHNPNLPRVVFVLIQWMSLCGSMILL